VISIVESALIRVLIGGVTAPKILLNGGDCRRMHRGECHGVCSDMKRIVERLCLTCKMNKMDLTRRSGLGKLL
jgi:hypothetical protein